MRREDLKIAMAKHIEKQLARPVEEIYKPAPGFWEAQLPTFMENWPSSLWSISIPSVMLQLTNEETRVLGSMIWELGEGFDVSDVPEVRRTEIRNKIVDWMNTQINSFPEGYAFVRLNSRSPKDSMYWGCHKDDDLDGKVRSGEEALRRLISCSERVYEDLQRDLAMNYPAYIVLRQWVNLESWQEFRCFQKNGKLVGISQYYYRHGALPEITRNHAGIQWAIEQFHKREFLPAVRANEALENVVFDVYVIRKERDLSNPFSPRDPHFPRGAEQISGNLVRWEVKLLEINPFFHLTDPCLFDWNKSEQFDGRFMYVGTSTGTVVHEPSSENPFSKGYKHRNGRPVSDACGDGRHSECDQDFTKCACTFRGDHTTMHAYASPAQVKALVNKEK